MWLAEPMAYEVPEEVMSCSAAFWVHMESYTGGLVEEVALCAQVVVRRWREDEIYANVDSEVE